MNTAAHIARHEKGGETMEQEKMATIENVTELYKQVPPEHQSEFLKTLLDIGVGIKIGYMLAKQQTA